MNYYQKMSMLPLWQIMLINIIIYESIRKLCYYIYIVYNNNQNYKKNDDLDPKQNINCSSDIMINNRSLDIDAKNSTENNQIPASNSDVNIDTVEQGHDLLCAPRNNYSLLDGQCKLVLCVNMSLSMGKGKIGAQCGHATLGAYKMTQKYAPSSLLVWENLGQAKIAVKIDNEDDMRAVEKKAIEKGLITYVVRDAGRTQIASGSKTVLAIGPAPNHMFVGITDHLKLL